MSESGQGLVLSIDLGGTKILSAVINRKGNLLARDHSITPAAKGPEAVIEAIRSSVESALEQVNMGISGVRAVGIGAPGPSNPDAGILFASPNLPGWENVPVKKIMEELFQKQAFLINDANAAALAEHRFGSGQGAHNLIYITVSTGIGGGIVINDKLYTGAIGTAAELGHMTINDTGPKCNCGNIGCWETLASGTALAREARRAVEKGEKTMIGDLVSGDLHKISAETVQKAAEQGDGPARRLIGQTAYYLGVGLANIINIFNPEMIIIGGGVSSMGSVLLDPAFETAGKRAYRAAYDAVRFERPYLGRNSGVLGAAAYVFDALEQASG